MLKKFCRCGKLINYTDKRCPECQEIYNRFLETKANKERYKKYQNNRTDYREQNFYKSKEWKALRQRVKARANGLCELCLKEGRISYYKDIHHIIPIKEDWNKRLDISNLICVCRDCHKKLHKELKKIDG